MLFVNFLVFFLLAHKDCGASRINIRSLGVGFTDFCRRFVFAPDCRGIQSKREWRETGVVEGNYLLFLPLNNNVAGFQNVKDPRPQIGSPAMEENNFLTTRSRRALASRGGERNVLVESPAWNLDRVEIIPQTVHNGHPWAQNALLETKIKTIPFQNDPMNMALQPTLLQYYPYNRDVRATNFLRGTIRPDPPEAPWGFVVPSSYNSQSGKRAGIFNYRFIRI